MKKIILLASILCCFLVKAQGENDNWYFGPGIGLNFQTNPPTLLSGGSMSTLEAVATISNPDGDLLFYTDGVTVWNRQHGAMPNGTGLLGSNNTQHVVILPYPGNNNLYYIFTCPPVFDSWQPSPFSHSAYTLVDMTLGPIGTNGLPLGDVVATQKNIELLDQNGNTFTVMSETIAATQHADGKSYWVLFPNGSNLHSYRLDSQGFHNLPVVSALPAPVDPVQTQIHMRVSPKLNGLSYSNLISLSRWPGGLTFNPQNYGIRVFSFNDNTGLITPDYLLTNTGTGIAAPFSSEFSSDGNLLYIVNYNSQSVWVFDLSNGSYRRLHVFANKNGGSIQRGVNNEIYLALQANTGDLGNDHLAMINNQNSYATCSVQMEGIFIGVDTMGSSNLGLPPLVPILSSPQDTCYDHLVFGFPESNNVVRQAGISVTTNNLYSVNSGLNVSLKAGSRVEMLPGTFIAPGANFVAQIDGCVNVSTGLRKNVSETDPVRFVINDSFTEQTVVAYPVPAKDRITVEAKGGFIETIDIYTLDGKRISSFRVNSGLHQLDVSNYQKGVYLLSVMTENKEIQTIKIMKE